MKSLFIILPLMGLQSLVFSACSTRRTRPHDVGPIHNSFDLLRIISSHTDSLRDLEARAKIFIRIDGVQQNTSAVVRYKFPDALKLDVTGALGIGLLHALAENDSLAVYLPRDNHYLRGLPEEILYRVTGVDLQFYDAQRAILGLPSTSVLDLPRVSSFETQGNSIYIEIKEPLWDRRICVDRRTATILREEIYDHHQGRLISQRLMADYREERGVILPRRIDIRQGTDQIRIDFGWRNVNSGINERVFRMKVPSDVIRVESEVSKEGE